MRVAVFYTPASDHPLTQAAAHWLGRDAFTGRTFDPQADAPFSAAELVDFTAEPRRYGFHATMKAPFRLREGTGLADVETLLAEFCRGATACPLPGLRIATLGPFFALVPAPPATAVNDLAAGVVKAFEPVRAPLDPGELARRRRGGLTPSQDANLVAWGYPYVLDEFRFHMTLTGPVPAERQSAMADVLQRRFGHLLQDVAIDSLALFLEEAPGADFRVYAGRRFAAGARVPIGS